MKSLILALAVALAAVISPRAAAAQDCHKCMSEGELFPVYWCQNFGPIQDGRRWCVENPNQFIPCEESYLPCGTDLANIDELFTTPFGTVLAVPKYTVSLMFGELLRACNGALVGAVYLPERAAAVRMATDHLVL